eukprot:14122981-Ditylum_brightwellii.AAC.1
MYVVIALLDCAVDLVFDKCIEILDLFGALAVLLGGPFGILNKTDLPESLLFHDMASGLNVLLASLIAVALLYVMVTMIT